VILEGKGTYSKYNPYAFTEHGVTMLASILKSDKAVKMNIEIVRAFINPSPIANASASNKKSGRPALSRHHRMPLKLLAPVKIIPVRRQLPAHKRIP
jgi:hypothetical protein